MRYPRLHLMSLQCDLIVVIDKQKVSSIKCCFFQHKEWTQGALTDSLLFFNFEFNSNFNINFNFIMFWHSRPCMAT